MWKTLRAAVEDGVKEFGREALSDATSTLKDVSVPNLTASSSPKILHIPCLGRSYFAEVLLLY